MKAKHLSIPSLLEQCPVEPLSSVTPRLRVAKVVKQPEFHFGWLVCQFCLARAMSQTADSRCCCTARPREHRLLRAPGLSSRGDVLLGAPERREQERQRNQRGHYAYHRENEPDVMAPLDCKASDK